MIKEKVMIVSILFSACLVALYVSTMILTVDATANTTHCVNPTGSSGCFSTITDAITAATSGDTVLVQPGTYNERVSVQPNIDVISMNGPAVTIIDATGLTTGVLFANSSIGRETLFEGFSVQNGNAPFYGGGILIQNSSPTISNTIVTNNSADSNGGGIGIWAQSGPANPLIENSSINSNTALQGGGGIYILDADAAAEIINTTFEENSSLRGGAIRVNTGSIDVKESTFRSNTSTSTGGAIRINCSSTAPAPSISGSTFEDNRSVLGGAINVENCAAITLMNNTVDDNSVTGTSAFGGGIYLKLSGATLTDNIITNNTIDSASISGQGGGIILEGATATLNGNTIDNNVSSCHGGGIAAISASTLIMRENNVRGNSLSLTSSGCGGGGGIDLRGSDNSGTFENNVITGNSGGQGGGVRISAGSAVVQNNTITSNQSSSSGGGIRVNCSGNIRSVDIISNTIDENQSYRGGGVDVENCPDFTLSTNSIDSNSSEGSAGVSIVGSSGTISANQITSNYHITPTETVSEGYQGGGISIEDSGSNPIVANNIITGNIAQCDAGGLGVFTGAAPTVTGNTISNNRAIGQAPCGAGGGIKIFNESDGLYQNNTIENNFGRSGGGGIFIEKNADPVIDGNLIRYNSTVEQGGGILIISNSNPEIMNNMIIKNIANDESSIGSGEGIYSFDQSSNIVNNTLVGYAGENGIEDVGIYVRNPGSSLIIYNNIVFKFSMGIQYTNHAEGSLGYNYLWNSKNYNSELSGIGDPAPTGPGIGSSTIDIAFKEEADLVSARDALSFFDPANDDYRLTASSSIILDAGSNAVMSASDFEGMTRPFNSTTDMGADEWATGSPITPLSATPYGCGLGCSDPLPVKLYVPMTTR